MNYFPRQLLDADAMRADQDYFISKSRCHNRYLHGWGVVCGLKVTAAATDELPWRIVVEPGYALSPYGDEIYVGERVYVDLARCGPGAVTDPCGPDLLHPGRSGTGGELFLAIKYAECVAKPVQVMPAGCACEEEACEYSRIRDSFQIECLTELPPSHEPQPESPNLCDFIEGKLLPRCPPCPSDPWVVLAHVTLPESSDSNIPDLDIDNFIRRQVFSTAVLQEQLIACCCKGELNADLAIAELTTKVGGGEGVQTVEYFITAINNGPSAAKEIVLTSSVNIETGTISLLSADGFKSDPGKWTKQAVAQDGQSAEFKADIGDLEPEEVAKLKFLVKLRGDAFSVKNAVHVESLVTKDPVDNNNDSEVTTPFGIFG
jgi:hypothetical protein